MKWIAISGSRKTDAKVEADVRKTVRAIFDHGDGIVAGGSLGVDFLATDEMLLLDPTARRIKIFLPATLARYAEHYRQRSKDRVITSDEAERLIAQLEAVKRANPNALHENTRNASVNEATYFERHNNILDTSEELIAFQVNESPGTADTIAKAEKRGMKVTKFSYTI